MGDRDQEWRETIEFGDGVIRTTGGETGACGLSHLEEKPAPSARVFICVNVHLRVFSSWGVLICASSSACMFICVCPHLLVSLSACVPICLCRHLLLSLSTCVLICVCPYLLVSLSACVLICLCPYLLVSLSTCFINCANPCFSVCEYPHQRVIQSAQVRLCCASTHTLCEIME